MLRHVHLDNTIPSYFNSIASLKELFRLRHNPNLKVRGRQRVRRGVIGDLYLGGGPPPEPCDQE